MKFSPELVTLLLQEVAANGPSIVADIKSGVVDNDTQQKLFEAVNNLTEMFKEPQWQKRNDV